MNASVPTLLLDVYLSAADTGLNNDSSDDAITIALANHVRLYHGTTDNRPTCAAVFVPATLTEDAMHACHVKFPSAVTYIDKHENTHFSQTLLGSVHAFLAHNFAVKSVILVRDEKHYPSDIVLLDLTHTPPTALVDMLETTNCELLRAGPEAVLKLVLISQVQYSASLKRHDLEVPTCPVCLYRIDPQSFGLPKPRKVCSRHCRTQCQQQRLLKPWPLPSYCVPCNVISSYWKNNADTNSEYFFSCGDCNMRETLWVCLVCGYLGCGRYSNMHAAKHFMECGHQYSLELATLRIWNYASALGEYAHRVDLVECPQSLPHVYPARLPRRESNRLTNDVLPTSAPKKATMITEEYEALLQSALEEQAQHYDGEISRLRARLTAEQVSRDSITNSEHAKIENLRQDISNIGLEVETVSRELLDLQAMEANQRAKSQELLREQQVSAEVLKRIKQETEAECREKQQEIEELTQQIADLTANQRMRLQFLQDQELSNSQIWGLGETRASNNRKRRKSRKGQKS